MRRVCCAQQLSPRSRSSNVLLHPQSTYQSRVVTVPGQCCDATPRRLHLLQHHHLKPPSPTEPPFVRYDTAEALQEEYRAQFLAWKAAGAAGLQTPAPQLISFQSTPTYTLGRQQDELTPAQAERLAQPLTVSLLRSSSSQGKASLVSYTPHIKKTHRGGLTTYHGPGQLVFWPVIDMHSPLYARFGVASYARHLEATTQRLLWDLFSLETYTNPDEPGVWVSTSGGGSMQQQQQQQPERKIAALGVHHRRHVTALGIALNIHLPVFGDDENQNPWARFVPCGLQGKLVTSVAAERTGLREDGSGAWDMDELAAQWASRFEEGLLDVEKRVV